MTGSGNPRPRVLIADDQQDVLEALRLLLKGEGYEVQSATSPSAVISALEASDFDVVLIDLNYTRDTTSGREGIDLLSRIRNIDETVPAVVMTAWGTIDLAVEAMRARRPRLRSKSHGKTPALLSIVRTQAELRTQAPSRGTTGG